MSGSFTAFETETALHDLLIEDVSFVVETYLSDTPLQLRTMSVAVTRRDFTLVARAARSLRSSSERVGAAEVARLAGKLGAVAGYRACAESAGSLVARLEAAFEKIAPELRSLLPRG